MNFETDGVTVNMSAVIDRIREATNDREHDDVFVVTGMDDLWEACHRFLIRFETTMLEKEDPGHPVHRDSGKPIGWDETRGFYGTSVRFYRDQGSREGR